MKGKRLKNFLVDKFDMPPEVMVKEYKLTLIARNKLIIENFGRIIEYTERRIRLTTKYGAMLIEGSNFSINNFGPDDIIIAGKIDGFEFLTEGENNDTGAD